MSSEHVLSEKDEKIRQLSNTVIQLEKIIMEKDEKIRVLSIKVVEILKEQWNSVHKNFKDEIIFMNKK